MIRHPNPGRQLHGGNVGDGTGRDRVRFAGWFGSAGPPRSANERSQLRRDGLGWLAGAPDPVGSPVAPAIFAIFLTGPRGSAGYGQGAGGVVDTVRSPYVLRPVVMESLRVQQLSVVTRVFEVRCCWPIRRCREGGDLPPPDLRKIETASSSLLELGPRVPGFSPPETRRRRGFEQEQPCDRERANATGPSPRPADGHPTRARTVAAAPGLVPV
jgi:hypothetical protein